MHDKTHTLSLLARQTRLINASEGLRLEVQSGCLWLTRPGDATDRFLVAGSCMDLHENLVLIQSDRHPGTTTLEAARYRLTPVQVLASEPRHPVAGRRSSPLAALRAMALSLTYFVWARKAEAGSS